MAATTRAPTAPASLVPVRPAVKKNNSPATACSRLEPTVGMKAGGAGAVRRCRSLGAGGVNAGMTAEGKARDKSRVWRC